MDTVDFYINTINSIKSKRHEKFLEEVRWRREHYPCCHEKIKGPHSRICINADAELGFTNRFVQHYPSSFTVRDCDYFILNFNTLKELLECEYVNKWSSSNGFYQYSISNKETYCEAALMVEFDDGYKWWCIGYIKSMTGINLPKWIPKYK